MSAGMPELGSKISLISKADIRYEGRLFTVDPKECTIALASVRSFGTEDRDTPYPVPAQNQVYDCILFRGSDIKDIRVVNNVTQPLNDPAIMQLSVPPTLGQQQFQSHPMLGHMGHMGQFGSGYGTMAGLSSGGLITNMGGGMPREHLSNRGGLIGNHNINKQNEFILTGVEPSSVHSTNIEQPHRPNDHGSVLEIIGGGGSRSTTPASLNSRKSPTTDQSVQTGNANKQVKKPPVKPIQPPGQQRNQQHSYHNSAQHHYQSHHHQQQQQQQQQQYHQRRGSQERRNSRGENVDYNKQRNQNRQSFNRNQNYHQGQDNQQNHDNHQQNSGWMSRPLIRQQRGRPRPSGGSSGNNTGFKPPNQGQPNQANKKNTLKFENDYDFEQANTEFEELRVQLVKTKIEDNVKSEVNGDIDKKDDSGNETGAGENEPEEDHNQQQQQQQQQNNEVFYDKTKSFFDKISCEAVERAKGKSQRTDWRTERKLNSETFGVAATRRGNYRGRGTFRGMGYGPGFRSGFNRPPPQRRDNNREQGGGNRPVNSQSQQSEQQQKNNSSSNQASAPVPATGGK